MTDVAAKEYKGLCRVAGPIIVLEGIEGVGYGEVVEVRSKGGAPRRGRVLEAGQKFVFVQVFEGTEGLSVSETRVRFLGRPFEMPVSKDMLGRIFTGIGEPLDSGPPAFAQTWRDINGLPINPVVRAYPRSYIQTGLSAIDGLNTLVRGQKLPIFSGSGLPHNEVAAQLVRQCAVQEGEAQLAIIFAAMGIKGDDAHFFQQTFAEAGAAANVTMFLNLANDPVEERMVTPRFALTLAEHLAFDEGMQVLVILTDMTNYCEALRELAAAREEVPSRKGYPGYMYTDLASLYERTGRLRGGDGSITQIPILTMPNMDITHPVPDLTGYITEGQLVLSQELHQRGIYPPVDILPCLSRLMKDGIGEGYTREDHPNLASQLYAAYAEAKRVRSLASIIGEEELTEIDRGYLQFGGDFEQKFIQQGPLENRSTEETLDLGWQTLSVLPERILTRVSPEQIDTYYPR